MSGQRRLQGRFIGWAAVAVLAAYALFVGGAWAPTYSVFFRVLTLILTTVGIGVWVVVAFRDPFWRPRTALAPAFAAAFAAFLISTIVSRYPRFGFEYLAWSILLAALYLLLQRLMASEFFRVRLFGFASLAGIAIGVWFTVAIVSNWTAWWTTVGRLTAPPLRPGFESLVFGNPSAVMTVDVLLITPLVAAFWGTSRARSALALGAVILGSFVTLASGSRAGWLAIGLAVAFTGVIWLVDANRRRQILSLAAAPLARVATIAAIASIVAVGWLIGPGLLIRAASGGESLRGVFYQASLRMFESSPVFGTGPGTWAPLRMSNTLAGETDYYIPHAHSLYFQTIAEFGVVGIAAGLIVALYLGRLIWRALKDADPMRRRIGWAAAFVTIYFGAHQLLDFYENAAAVVFVFAIPIAWLDATDRTRMWSWPPALNMEPLASRFHRPGVVAALTSTALAVAFLVWSETAAYRMNDGTISLNDRHIAASVEPLEQAVAMDPAMPPYHFALGLALANTGDPTRAAGEFLTSASMDDLPVAWLNLAALRVEMGDVRGAQDALARALRLGNQQPAVALAAGTIAMRLGDGLTTTSAFTDAMLLLPSLAGDPWWQENVTRKNAWSVAYQAAITEASPTGRFELLLETGDKRAARDTLSAVDDAATRSALELVLAAWDGTPDAVADLVQLAHDRPLDTTLINWCARVLRRNDQKLQAETFETWAEQDSALSSVNGFEARVVDPDSSFHLVGVATLFYGHFTYRRPTPTIQFVPGLPLIGFN